LDIFFLRFGLKDCDRLPSPKIRHIYIPTNEPWTGYERRWRAGDPQYLVILYIPFKPGPPFARMPRASALRKNPHRLRLFGARHHFLCQDSIAITSAMARCARSIAESV
jgi:hypothetical protein